MEVLDKLIKSSSSVENLEIFLEIEITNLYELLITSKFIDLSEQKEKLNDYILDNIKIIRKLNLSSSKTITFYNLLLIVSEKFCFLNTFPIIYKLLKKTDSKISYRLQAASLFLIDIKTSNDYLDRFEKINELLDSAFQEEEDNINPVLTTIVYYYSQVVINFSKSNIEAVLLFKNKIENIINEKKDSFLNHELILSVLSIDCTLLIAYSQIHKCLDDFLEREIILNLNDNLILIESKTSYSNILATVEVNFISIRKISVEIQKSLIEKDKIFNGLQRGVKILTLTEELTCYISSFGNMHYEKLMSAYKYLPEESFDGNMHIIDWACGQAIATMSLLDFIKNNKKICDIKKINLIEPSELALKRGCLHLNIYNPNFKIKTTNKTLDLLENLDLKSPNSKQHYIHLFSNILDIDLFSLPQLIAKIKDNFAGINYFVCVSPSISLLKNSRIDGFVSGFQNKHNFLIHKSITNGKGEWNINASWTRVIRVFQVDL